MADDSARYRIVYRRGAGSGEVSTIVSFPADIAPSEGSLVELGEEVVVVDRVTYCFRVVGSSQGHKFSHVRLDCSPVAESSAAAYRSHHRENAEGHIYIAKSGPCTIDLHGTASMDQEELDYYGEIMARALGQAPPFVAGAAGKAK